MFTIKGVSWMMITLMVLVIVIALVILFQKEETVKDSAGKVIGETRKVFGIKLSEKVV